MTGPVRASYWSVRLARNLGIALMAGVIAVVVFALSNDKPSWSFRASMAAGYASTALLAWALALGPWRTVRGVITPTSLDLRRDIGIWSGLLAIAHVVTGLQVHMRGDMLRYFVFRPEDGDHRIPIRTDPFGVTNWTGLAATVLFLFLLAISNNIALRELGAKRWKRWQRWTYVAAILTLLHGIAFQLMDRRSPIFIAALAGIALTVIILHVTGRRFFPRLRQSPQSDLTG
jgi:methionine sulfoxide reductase heme-binding subunit